MTEGVPDIVPEVDMTRPEGKPVAVKVYVPPAPLAPLRVTGVMATPCVALMTAQVVEGTAATVMPQVLVAGARTESVVSTTLAVKLKVPALVGVHEIRPVEVFRLRPRGKEPPVMEKA